MGTFALDFGKFRDKTNVKRKAVVKKIVLDLSTSLVLKSPVGDAKYWKSPAPEGYVGGRFRGNWQYGVGAIDHTVSNPVDANGQNTLSAIATKLSDEVAPISYITNSLPYGPRLENGWSRQAPHGMVALTVNEFKPIVAAAAKAFK